MLHESASDAQIAVMAARPSPDLRPESKLSLDPERIVRTISQLNHRIDERFPGSGLGRVCASLLDVGDYCSELLALTSKLAALYAERFNDSVVLQAVDEVEALTSGLSAKIWQKIMVLDAID